MALARVKTWSSGEVLTAADLNAEFNNILNNPISLISPLTANINANNKQLTSLILENLSASVTPATEGRVYYQTTLDQLEIDDGTNVRRVPTIASMATGDVLYAASSTQWTRLAVGSNGDTMQLSSGLPAWVAASTARTNLGLGTMATQNANAVNITGGNIAGITDLVVADGGTGVSTLASNGVLYGNGTGVVQVTAQGGANTVLTANAGAPSFSATPTVTSLTANTSITVGSGGTAVTKHVSSTVSKAAADYSANPIAANTAATFAMTVSGAATGNVAHASPDGSPGANLVWSAYVSATDVVTVVVANPATSSVAPTTRTWRAEVWNH